MAGFESWGLIIVGLRTVILVGHKTHAIASISSSVKSPAPNIRYDLSARR